MNWVFLSVSGFPTQRQTGDGLLVQYTRIKNPVLEFLADKPLSSSGKTQEYIRNGYHNVTSFHGCSCPVQFGDFLFTGSDRVVQVETNSTNTSSSRNFSIYSLILVELHETLSIVTSSQSFWPEFNEQRSMISCHSCWEGYLKPVFKEIVLEFAWVLYILDTVIIVLQRDNVRVEIYLSY